MKAVILLGCDGRQDNSFVFCRGIRNIILDLEKRQLAENFPELIEYIEKVPKLFSASCCNTNVIMNTLYKMHELGFLNETQYKYTTLFVQMHKACGLVLKIYKKE